MTYNYETKKFEGKYKFDLIDLYAANGDVTFTFSITDWYGNTYTHTGETIDVKFTPDNDLPEITYLSAKEIENQNSLSIDVLLSVRDTFIQHASITEIDETGLNSTYLPQSSLSGALFKFEFKLNYSVDTNLACYTFFINLEDIAGNTVNQMFEIDLIDPNRASNCEQLNTNSDEISTTQTDSAIFSLSLIHI